MKEPANLVYETRLTISKIGVRNEPKWDSHTIFEVPCNKEVQLVAHDEKNHWAKIMVKREGKSDCLENNLQGWVPFRFLANQDYSFHYE